MAEEDLIYPFEYRTFMVHTVAVFGQNAPVVCRGPLILRFYFRDNTRSSVDVARTSEAMRDTIFYESNKIIRIRRDESFGERRILREVSFPELGREYRLVYNIAEKHSAPDDNLTLLQGTDSAACGLAIILRRNEDNGIEWLSREECERIVNFLSGR